MPTRALATATANIDHPPSYLDSTDVVSPYQNTRLLPSATAPKDAQPVAQENLASNDTVIPKSNVTEVDLDGVLRVVVYKARNLPEGVHQGVRCEIQLGLDKFRTSVVTDEVIVSPSMYRW